MTKQVRLHGAIVGRRREQVDIARAIEAMEIKPPVNRCFALEELAEAFRYEESGAHFGKIGFSWQARPFPCVLTSGGSGARLRSARPRAGRPNPRTSIRNAWRCGRPFPSRRE
ncbi:zinc-binding dehydrogenase [Novosphingobium sp. BW1]|nr:zinc-binding dehydrogenase [Novosphingobium sp. BW1]TYC89715.1 zinc-binding dehydrogenase [Novosphingobium sp. BW1]